jgi:hypothetical protein
LLAEPCPAHLIVTGSCSVGGTRGLSPHLRGARRGGRQGGGAPLVLHGAVVVRVKAVRHGVSTPRPALLPGALRPALYAELARRGVATPLDPPAPGGRRPPGSAAPAAPPGASARTARAGTQRRRDAAAGARSLPEPPRRELSAGVAPRAKERKGVAGQLSPRDCDMLAAHCSERRAP